MTEYVVLYASEGTWKIGSMSVKARSARAAVRALLSEDEHPKLSDGHEFVAVPRRSWQPVTVKIETKTELRFS